MYVCVGFGSVDVPPSPKSQAYVIGVPSGSREPADENVTSSGTGPPSGVTLACAIGSREPWT